MGHWKVGNHECWKHENIEIDSSLIGNRTYDKHEYRKYDKWNT